MQACRVFVSLLLKLLFFIIEDFANDIELTEEEQIRLLEQYENETKQKKQENPTKSRVPKKLIGEKILFQQSPSKDEQSNKRPSVDETSSDPAITKVDSTASLETASSTSSDGDWEKISVVDK